MYYFKVVVFKLNFQNLVLLNQGFIAHKEA